MADDTTRTGDVEITTDHGTIRDWVEGHDATVARLAEPTADDANLMVVPEGRTDDSVRELSWDEFFEVFEEEGLALVCRTGTDGAGGRPDCEFVERGTIGAGTESPADETTSRGKADEDGIDERTFGESADETRAEDDVTEESIEGVPLHGEPSAPGETAEPAEPLESEVETTDTLERDPLGSEAAGENPEPMETAADEEGVEPAEPGAPAPEEGIPSDREPPASEPAEPAEGDIGGEPIESGSITGEEAGLSDDPDRTDVTSDEPGAGSDLVGKGVVDETGDRIGVVAGVEEGAIRVDPDPELSDEQRGALGREERGSETYRLERDRVRETTATEVVIRR